MKKWFYAIPIGLLCLASCAETEQAGEYDNWKQRNGDFLDSLETVYSNRTPDAEGRLLQRFNLIREPDEVIYYKVKTPTTDVDPNGGYEYLPGYVREDVKPKATDRVQVYYKGTLINGEYFDGFEGQNPTVSDAPITAVVNQGIIPGWQEVLQQMSVGERWEVFIPAEYGYGTVDKTGIPAHSLLVFDMQLFKIVPEK